MLNTAVLLDALLSEKSFVLFAFFFVLASEVAELDDLLLREGKVLLDALRQDVLGIHCVRNVQQRAGGAYHDVLWVYIFPYLS